MGLAASLTPPRLTVEPGTGAQATLKISNTGNTVGAYALEVLGEPAAWATIEPARVEGLYPGASTTATVTFRPPRSPDAPAGDKKYALRVRPITGHGPDPAEGVPQAGTPGAAPAEDPAGAVPEGVIEVLPFRDTAGELLPRIAHGRWGARIRAAIDNNGNAPVSLTLKGTDAGEKLGIEAEPDEITVMPGLAGFSAVRLRARKTIWRGPDETHQLKVTAVSAEGAEHVWLGTFVQQAVIPAWLPKALVALVALLALLAGVWFFLLKPAAEAAAEAAIAEPLEQAQQLSAAAQNSAVAAEGAADRATGVSGGESSVSKPQAVRLQVASEPGQASRESTTSFEGETFRLTDLVLSNPQGDLGRVQIITGADVLFDVALENFRDLDLHFQTPVVVAEGDAIGLRVTCRQAGAPPEQAPSPTSCDTAVYLGGTTLPAPSPAG